MRTVILGRDNTFDLLLEKNGTPENASNYTRWAVYLKESKQGTSVTIDSQTAPAGTFDATQQVYWRGQLTNVLRCKLGLGSFGLVAGKTYECWVRVYNALLPNGLTWPDNEDTFRVKVVSGP